MAKKRVKKMTTRRRTRRSKTSIGSVGIITPLYMVGGAILGKVLINQLGKVLPVLKGSGAITGGAQIGAGVIVPMVAKMVGVKSPIVSALGSGMIVSGGLDLVKNFAPNVIGQSDGLVVVSGMDEMSELNDIDQIGGDLAELNGLDQIGMDEMENEYNY
jgi:hypothetical protein